MKSKLIPLFFFNLLFLSCICLGQIKNKSANTLHYKIDSTFNNVMIGNNFFQVQLLQKIDTNQTDKNQMALVIKDRTGKKQVYKKYFTENKYNIFKPASETLDKYGKLFFEVISDGGGSGFSGKCFVISDSNKVINLIPAYTLDELSLLYFIGDTAIIKMEGTWNFKEEESHFGNHRYVLTRFTYTNGKFIAIKLGATKFKYESMDGDNSPKKLLLQIKKNEPHLLRTLQLKQ